MSINSFVVAGHVGKDPESFTIEEGEKKGEIITTFSLAENLGNDLVAWHKVSAGGKLGELIANSVVKGTKLVVRGRARASAYINKEQKLIPQIQIWLQDFEFASDKINTTEYGEAVEITPAVAAKINVAETLS